VNSLSIGSRKQDSALTASVFLVLMTFLAPCTVRGEGPATRLEECAGIADNVERLRCYDAVPKEREPSSKAGGTYLTEIWELDETTRVRKFPITPYRSNYILPLTYNRTPNDAAVQETDPGKELDHYEVAYQISFKFKLWEDVLGGKADLWAAYTQVSFWQFYDRADSSPFRETDYEPEILLNFRTDYRLLGLKGRFLNVGFNHQSNGRSEPLSRSWNRVVANAGFDRGPVALILSAWYRIPEKDVDDDNPGIEDFMGYGQLTAYWFLGNHRLGVDLRNNLDFRDNRGAVQLEWAFPLTRWVNGYVRYFNGYGESLLDYNASSNRIGAGFVLKDW
jgi:phospholipase A1